MKSNPKKHFAKIKTRAFINHWSAFIYIILLIFDNKYFRLFGNMGFKLTDSLTHIVMFSFVDQITVVCELIWTFFAALPPRI